MGQIRILAIKHLVTREMLKDAMAGESDLKQMIRDNLMRKLVHVGLPVGTPIHYREEQFVEYEDHEGHPRRRPVIIPDEPTWTLLEITAETQVDEDLIDKSKVS